MSKLVNFAKDFAIKSHGTQLHGCLNIDKHLANVAKHVERHAEHHSAIYDHGLTEYVDCLVAAAWLHDVIEDTNVTIDDLEDEMVERGFANQITPVVSIVSAVTDEPGKSRMERHMNTYWKIRAHEGALLVKLCDRRHNQSRSIKHGEIYAAMYAKEYNYFKFALWKPGQFEELWDELDNQNKKLQEIIGW